MRIDPILVHTHLIDSPQNEQFFAERLERLEHSPEFFLLQWGRDAQSKKHIKRPHRHDGWFGGLHRSHHFFEKRQADRDCAKALEHGPSADFSTHVSSFLSAFSVSVMRTKSL